jgi:hypothetical protein
MKSFRELLGLGDPLLKQADTLVHVAEINANSAFTPLLKKFSFLRESRCKTLGFHPDDCGRVRENRQRKLMGKVGAKLIQRHPSNGRHGFEDCAAFLREKFKRVCK